MPYQKFFITMISMPSLALILGKVKKLWFYVCSQQCQNIFYRHPHFFPDESLVTFKLFLRSLCPFKLLTYIWLWLLTFEKLLCLFLIRFLNHPPGHNLRCDRKFGSINERSTDDLLASVNEAWSSFLRGFPDRAWYKSLISELLSDGFYPSFCILSEVSFLTGLLLQLYFFFYHQLWIIHEWFQL